MKVRRGIAATSIAATLGFAAVVLPPIMAGVPQTRSSPLFPLVANSWEHMMPLPTLAGLLVTGLLIGYFFPRYWWIGGLASMLVFPMVTFAELVVDSSSHNLFPFELLIQFCLSLVAVGGAWIGARLGSRRALRGPQ